VQSAIQSWQRLLNDPFFLSAVVESDPPIKGHRVIGFGSAILVDSRFADDEICNPRPYIASRVISSLYTGSSAPATRDLVAKANALNGIDVAILYNGWRDDILVPDEKHAVRVALTTSLAEVLTGFHIHRIIAETTSRAPTEFHLSSPEFRTLAEFPAIGHVIHLMTRESARALPGSIGNLIFKFDPPLLRLRDSDQQLLVAALKGATDSELAVQLGISISAVKARWRSTYARIAEVMPVLTNEIGDSETRGAQKRHRVLAYLRSHMEELRPYDWSKARPLERSARAVTT
jgi:DNA-binding CsgD family transcriptional regulator